MEEKIKISIIIPVYNTSKYLEQCLDSVINQTLSGIEIICVDDGSTDKSLEILKNYQQKDNRIKILTQNHKKQGKARNYGISVAQGEYIGFVDSDDWCELDMFEKLYEKAIKTDSDITMCAVTTYNDNNNGEFSQANTYANLDIFPKDFLNKVFSPQETFDFFMDICSYPPNKIVKRDLIISNNIKFPENIFFGEDGPFFYNVWLNAKRISLIKHFGYYYRMYSDTSTCFNKDTFKLEIFKGLKQKEHILKKQGIYKKLKKEFIAYKKKSILYWLNKIENKKVKFLYLMLICLNMPSCMLNPIRLFKKELSLLLKIIINNKKRIVFWGASLFLENFLKTYYVKNKNIVGIIDKNPAKQNTIIGNYACYSPEKIKELNADILIITIINFSKSNQQSIKEFLLSTGQKNITIECV